MRGTKYEISEIMEVFNKKYPEYSLDLTKYNSIRDKVQIYCPKHGVYEKYVWNILAGEAECKECKKNNKRQEKLKVAFIEKARKVHGDKYEYPGEYIDRNVNMVMKCPIHGEFEQHPSNHLKGRGCKRCGLTRTHDSIRRDFKSILDECRIVHNNFYTYLMPEDEYQNRQQKMEIMCPIHGSFYQKIGPHLMGQRCPRCASKMSKQHLAIERLLAEWGIDFKSNDKSVLGGNLELDIIIPDKKVAIEVNGAFWHREGLIETHTRTYAGKNYHLDKTKRCEEIGWRLIHIFDYEWNDKEELLTKKLKHILNICENSSIFARKCKVSEISSKQSWKFLEENHIQGKDSGSIRLGLFFENEMVGVMTFLGKSGNYKLSRFATSKQVVGGFSKLLTHFEREYKPRIIETFADRRFSKLGEDVYTKTGFTFVDYTEPSYRYYNVETGEVVNRQSFMRHKLYEKYPEFEKLGLTEKQIAIKLGFDRIYDCGHLKFFKTYKI